ncbi:hypothetical protein O5154_28840, partial [Escherichia coli]|nr:hypothetical protein [Escherichia coli]
LFLFANVEPIAQIIARHQLTAKILQWGDGQDSPILQSRPS